MKVLPIFLNNLEGRRCVVFGHTHETASKVRDLLACDADVTLIHPTLPHDLEAEAAEGRLRWERRAYRPGDLAGAFLAIATEVRPDYTAPIWDEAQRERVLFNAMDDTPHCSFVAGSVIRRGPLVVSISSSGMAPALSVRLRQQLEAAVTEAHGRFAAFLGGIREAMRARYPDFDERRKTYYALVDSDVLALMAARRDDDALRAAAAIAGEDVVFPEAP